MSSIFRSFRHAVPILALAALPLNAATTASVLADMRSKAEKGNAVAQYNLGLIYADPTEPATDMAEAYTWLNLAAENGATGNALNNVTQQMSAAQLAEGKRRLAARRTTLAQAAALSPSPITPADRGDRSPFLTPPSATADTAKVQEELTALRAEKKQLSSELALAWKETEAAKNASISKVGELNQQLAAKEKELAALKAQLESAPKAAAAPSPELTAKAEALTKAEAARDQLSRDLAALSTEANNLKTQLAAEQKARSELAAQALAASQASHEVGSLREQLSKAQAALTAEQQTRTNLSEQLKQLTTEKNALASRAGGANDSAQQQLTSLKGDLEKTRAALAEKDAAIARATDESRHLNEELAAARQNSAPNAEVAALREQLDAARHSLSTTEAERDSLKQQVASAAPASPTVDVEGLTKSLADSESKLTASLRTYTLQHQELERTQNALADMDRERAALATQLEAANQERSMLSSNLSTASAAAAEAQTLRSELDAAQSELTSLRARTAELIPIAAEAGNLREQLRQTQQQSAAGALEVNQLKTRLALATPPPATTLSSPTRPGSGVTFAAPPPAAANAQPALSAGAATPKAEAAAAAPARSGRQHVVAAGDSLTRIARRYYGDPNRWTEIIAANRDVIPNPNVLVVGSTLKIP